MAVRFAGYPSATIFAGSSGRESVGQCLWGDFVSVTGPEENGRVPVRSRRVGWMEAGALQQDRLLEIIFVDIGQGDGVLMVTPDDRAVLIDAGEGDNMYRFLRWRFGRFQRPFHFPVVFVSHGDLDHYQGFGALFDEPNLTFGTVYHNGMVELADRTGVHALGPRVASGGRKWVTGLVTDDSQMRALLSDPAKVGRRRYAGLLRNLARSGRVERFEALSRPPDEPRFVPGFGPGDDLALEIMGPIQEEVAGEPALRWLGNAGLTKNGHSIVLKLAYGKIKILLGGDLNTPSEQLLLGAHTGMEPPEEGEPASDAFLARARQAFQVDIAKACHHGSADFSETFLRAVNPLVTVVSSGDEESHAHPRPDALGAYGLCGRPPRPMIFSTELFRSTAERIKHPNRYRARILELVDEMVEAGVAGQAERQKQASDALKEHLVDIDRSVNLYGAINLRTDGEKAIVAYRIEQPRSPAHKWDIYEFEAGPGDEVQLVQAP